MPEKTSVPLDQSRQVISARQKQASAENKLSQTDQWLRMLIDTAEDYAIFAVNPRGKIVTWNKGAEKLFGYPENEILDHDFSMIFTPEDRENGAPEQEINEALSHGYSPDERWHLRKDGSRLFVSGSVRPLRDKYGSIHGFLKVAHDITAMKQSQETEAQFRALFESAPGLYLVLTPNNYEILTASDAYLSATSTERNQIVGRCLFDVFPDDPTNPRCNGAQNLRSSLDRVVKERRRDVMPVQYYPIPRPARLGGGFEDRWWSPINTPVFDSKGRVTHIIHRVEDMTPFIRQMEKQHLPTDAFQPPDPRLQQMAEEIILRSREIQRASEELRNSRAQFEAVFQTMHDGVIVSDPNGKILLVNESTARIAGVPSPEDLRKSRAELATMFSLSSPEGSPVPSTEGPLSRILRGETLTDCQLRVRPLFAENEEWFLSFSGQPILDADGHIALAVLIIHDVTNAKRSEAELTAARDQLARVNQELEARVRERTASLTETIQELERFSYSLSHDMRAPLRAIASYAQILRGDFSKGLEPEADEMLNRIITAATRLDQLILDVLSLSRVRNGPSRAHTMDLEKLLQQIIHERNSLQPPRADIEIKKPLLKVIGHEALMTQCLSNLLDNAVKFIAPGVHPCVRVWTEPAANHSEDPRGFVRIFIKDNGIGIPSEYHDRIFAMFERLHATESYHGTGIGLAIVRKAVERMGGKVGVDSEPGKGSTFWLDLPSAEPLMRELREMHESSLQE